MKSVKYQNEFCRFYFRWPSDGDRWFIFGKSWIGSYRYLKSDDTRIEMYGWHLVVGPLNFIFCKPPL